MAKHEEESPIEKFTSQLSARIWGHRFKSSQRGPEYVLEFLNVLAGTKYCFSAEKYNRKLSIGLRKFIFEGVKSGSGSKKLCTLSDEEKQKLVLTVQEDNYYALKGFLRNLEVTLYDTNGKESDRSWYARSVYPLHESLLFFEVRVKGNEDVRVKGNGPSIERNFYARGGELYYLMLAFGTDRHPDRRAFIEKRFQQLLNKNVVIDRVVSKIASAFEGEAETSIGKLRDEPNDTNAPHLPGAARQERPYLPGAAPRENGPLFEQFAVELGNLLQLDLDIYEMFQLITSLVCFQLARYMQERATTGSTRSVFFFDCLDGRQKHLVQLSSLTFEQHENQIKERFDQEFERKYPEMLGDPAKIEEMLPQWQADTEAFLKLIGLNKLRSRSELIVQALKACKGAHDVHGKLKRVVRQTVSDQLNKNLLHITRTLGRDGGFATFRRGSASNYRYTLSDSFLQTLVFMTIKPGEKMEFSAFLDAISRDCGIVIGENEAKSSKLYAESRLNARYFQENEKAMREKLRQNGLLIEFSDATAMVRNPNACVLEESYA